MKKPEDFPGIISKLTEDMAKYKAHRFAYSSKQLKKKLLKIIEKTMGEIKRSINVVSMEINNLKAQYNNSAKVNVEDLMRSGNNDKSDSDLNYLRGAVKHLQKLIRDSARDKYSYSEEFDSVISMIPAYGAMSPEFPVNSLFLGILEEDEMMETEQSETREYFKKKMESLLAERNRIDEIFLTKLKLFIQVQKILLTDAENNYSFLLNNSIDDLSTVQHFARYCKKGFLDSLD